MLMSSRSCRRLTILSVALVLAAGCAESSLISQRAAGARSLQVMGASGPHSKNADWAAAPRGRLFGVTVALFENTLVVGDPGSYAPESKEFGVAYIFIRSGGSWALQAILTASERTKRNLFGAAVAISNDTVVIGAPHADVDETTAAGAAYVFVRNGTAWTQQAKLSKATAQKDSYFGGSVAVSEDTAIVGDRADQTQAGGAAYVYVRRGTEWTQQGRIHASGSGKGDQFGAANGRI